MIVGDTDDDYLKFLENIRDYLSYPLKFIETNDGCPVAILKDIKIYFVHYPTSEESERKWKDRLTRMNFDNVYIIFRSLHGLTEEQYTRLKKIPCQNSIVYSAENATGKTDLRIKGYFSPEFPAWKRTVPFGIRLWEKAFDYVGFLNVKKESSS